MIQWREMEFAYPENKKAIIGRTHTHVIELIPTFRTENPTYTNMIKFDYYKVKLRRIGEITANFIAVIFIKDIARVQRRGREYQVLEQGTEEMFKTHSHSLMSAMATYRIPQLKFYDSLDRKELYADVEEALTDLGYIHGLRKLNTIGD